jgi:hypothetical protein
MCHFREFDEARWEELEETEKDPEPAEAMDVPTMAEPEIEEPTIEEPEIADD